MRVQAASTERASACRNAGLADVRRAEAVSTTTVANAGKNSTLGADAMHSALPLKGVVPGLWSLGSDTLRTRQRRGGRGSSCRSRCN